jgi:hypothetical protein
MTLRQSTRPVRTPSIGATASAKTRAGQRRIRTRLGLAASMKQGPPRGVRRWVRALPAIGESVAVLIGGRADGHGMPSRFSPLAMARSPCHRGTRRSSGAPPRPRPRRWRGPGAGNLGGLTRVRVRSTVRDNVAVRRPATLMAALVGHLSVHGCPHPGLHVLLLGLAHPAEHTHQHLVRRVAILEPTAQLRHPQIHLVGREPGRDQRELVTEPAARPLANNNRVAAPIVAARVAAGGVGTRPWRLDAVERALAGHAGGVRGRRCPRHRRCPSPGTQRIQTGSSAQDCRAGADRSGRVVTSHRLSA